MLKLYNSLTKKLEDVKVNKNDVRIYLCGPTVQSSPHLGHGRSAVVFDFFVRYLKYLNYSVLFVRNVTDIDDKIIIKSQEKKISYRELGNSVWNEFVSAHENLNCLVPDIEPRATAYIPEIIKYIQQLIDNGCPKSPFNRRIWNENYGLIKINIHDKKYDHMFNNNYDSDNKDNENNKDEVVFMNSRDRELFTKPVYSYYCSEKCVEKTIHLQTERAKLHKIKPKFYLL